MDEHKIRREYEQLRQDVNMDKLERVSKVSRIVSMVVIPVLFLLFTYGAIRLNRLYRELDSLEALKQAEQLKMETIRFEKQALEQKKMQLETELMNTYGLSIDSITSLSSSRILEISVSANNAIKDIIRHYSPKQHVVVRYYKKTIDEKRIVIELEALGYGFQEKPASEYMSMKKTNAIWFGSGVPLEDTKIVALSLLRAGIPVRGIRPFRRSADEPDYKKNIIEVGASVDLEQKPVLSVGWVQQAEAFTR